ncbi:MAG TPA: hypothetical protein PK597_06675 [Oscillospiraceae bacterium]|nr:hypothetical protein [Oscillospiraceae bacterium]
MKRKHFLPLFCAALLIALCACAKEKTEDDPGGYKALFRERFAATQLVARHYTDAADSESSETFTDEDGKLWRLCTHYSSIDELREATLTVFDDTYAAGLLRMLDAEPLSYQERDGKLWVEPNLLLDQSPWLSEDTFEWDGKTYETFLWDTLTVTEQADDRVSYTLDWYSYYPGDPETGVFTLVKSGEEWKFATCFYEDQPEETPSTTPSPLPETVPQDVQAKAMAYLAEGGNEVRLTSIKPAAVYPDLAGKRIEVYAVSWELLAVRNGAQAWIGMTFSGGPDYLFFQQENGIYTILDGRSVADGELDAAALGVAWGVPDAEFTLSREGHDDLCGLGGPGVSFMDGVGTKTKLDYELSYADGDFWEKTAWDGLTIECYVDADGERSVISLSTTLPDVSAYRGVSMGDTREAVLAAYPEARSDSCWGLEGDYLWYCKNEEGWGNTLLFYFENDLVVRIELRNFFD